MIARMLPVIDRDNEAYWTWGRDGKLAIHRCAACEYYVHPPVPFARAAKAATSRRRRSRGGAGW